MTVEAPGVLICSFVAVRLKADVFVSEFGDGLVPEVVKVGEEVGIDIEGVVNVEVEAGEVAGVEVTDDNEFSDDAFGGSMDGGGTGRDIRGAVPKT